MRLHTNIDGIGAACALSAGILAPLATAQSGDLFNVDAEYAVSAWSAVLADVNADTHLDIIAATGGSVTVLLNDGTGIFGDPIVSPASASEVAAADLDGDGDIDVAVIGNGALGILLNDGSTTCIGDLDDSGDVGFDDLLAVLSGWGECNGCPEDIDESGRVGFGDLLAILSVWGDCG